MIQVVHWLVVAEVLSLTFLPLSTWLFQTLPDRGFAFAKVLGLLLVGWFTWWLGIFAPVGNSLLLPWSMIVLAGAGFWSNWGHRTLSLLRRRLTLLLIEETIFVVGFVLWSLARSFHPDITGTEKPMDLMLLEATGRASHFPPVDLWLSGHTVNYYYFGYLLIAMMGRLSGTSFLVSYNLGLALILGLGLAGSYSIAYNLSHSARWAILGPTFVMALGNAHSVFFQVIQGRLPWNTPGWYWESSRIVGESAPGIATTINEFPAFSMILGDLHPHVMDIPLVFMSIAGALTLATGIDCSGGKRLATHPVRIVLIGIGIGALFATNSWDFPTYLLLALAAIILGCVREATLVRHNEASAECDPESRPAKKASLTFKVGTTAGLLSVTAVAAFLPFYLEYRSPTQGLGRVNTLTSFGQFAQVFGFFGFVSSAFLAYLLWQPRDVHFSLPRFGSGRITNARSRHSFSAPTTWGLVGASLGLMTAVAILDLWVIATGVTVAACGVWVLFKHELSAIDGFVILLAILCGCIICGTELVYVRDSFDGSVFYRMNTVFKFYYQVWIMIALTAAYSAFRLWQTLCKLNIFLSAMWGVLLLSGLAIGGTYSVLGFISYYGTSTTPGAVVLTPHSLDGLESLAAQDRPDFLAIQWIRRHIRGSPIILEATGGDYTTFARVSTYTGLPTLLGWEGHEQQWRGDIHLLALRHALIDRIYSTGSVERARRLIRSNGISLVYVGTCEHQVYSGQSVGNQGPCGWATPVASSAHSLTKFARFMYVIYSHDGVTIYQMPG